MKISSAAAKEIAETVSDLFKKIPSMQQFSASAPADMPSLWRGIRSMDQVEVTDAGDLVLKPAGNFGGKTFGVSFTDDPSVARRYSNSQPESPVPSPGGVVFRVNRNMFSEPDFLKGETNPGRPRLSYEGMEGEHAVYTREPIVVPKGSWDVEIDDLEVIDKAKKILIKEIMRIAELPDEKLIRRYAQSLEAMELEEHTGGIDPFGFDSIRARAEEAANSDRVTQLLYWHLTDYQKIGLAIDARLRSAKTFEEQEDLFEKFNDIANEQGLTALYGLDWFKSDY